MKNTKKIKKRDYSNKFHDSINKLIKNLGAKIIDVNYFGEGADTTFEIDGHKVLIQCKAAKKEGKPYLGVKRLADEYTTKIKREKAEIAILAFEKYKISDKYLGDKLLKRNKVVIWNDRIIEYYRRAAECLGKYSKYSLMGELGIKEKSGLEISVPAIKITQNKKEFFVFKMLPEHLLKCGYVFRRSYNPKAYQRMLTKSRLKDIGSFLKGKENVFPNNIICVFKDKVKYNEKKGILTIPCKYSSIWIIDGQHRLFGFCYAPKETREHFFLICVGFNVKGLRKSYLREDQQARLFSDINSKAKKIPKDLLLEIQELYGEYDRRIAIVKKLMGLSIFKRKIQTSTEKGHIHFTTFVTTPPMWDLVNDNGIILKSKISKKIRSMEENEKIKVYEKACYEIFKDYFRLIAKMYKKAWNKPDDYIIASDRGIRGFLRLLIEIFKYTEKWNKKITEKVLKRLKNFDFRTTNLRGKYLGEAGADELLKDLVEIVQEEIPDFGPLSKKVGEQIFKPGEISKSESYIKRIFNNFEGEIIGELMFIDETTVEYLKWIPQSCGIRLIVRGVRPDKEALHDKIKMEMNDWKYVRVKEICSFDKNNKERTFFHERWISDEKTFVTLGVDLKKDALHPKHTVTIHDEPRLSKQCREFRKIWDSGQTELERDLKLPTVKITQVA